MLCRWWRISLPFTHLFSCVFHALPPSFLYTNYLFTPTLNKVLPL